MTSTNEKEASGPTGAPGQGSSTGSEGRCGRRYGPGLAQGCGPRGYAGPYWAAGAGAGPWGPRRVPVNIEETGDAFIIAMFAAGLDKSAFHISVKDDVLTIRYEAAEASHSRRFTRRELQQESFEREFALNGKVSTEAIDARYENGVLTLRLPKNPDAMQPARNVTVQ
jgi:HSP20 family protein